LLHDLFHWMQNTWGASPDGSVPSYSQALLGSPNAWGLLEGSHLLMLMLFFGTILFVDLRMLGIAFRKQPLSVISNKVLPLTVVAMVIVIATGVILFFSKPEEYWHNIWFRTKMILLAIAIANVVIFHKIFQKDQADWDTMESPPRKAKISAIISLTSWVLVIACGRFIAYNWFECGKPQPAWVNTASGCAISSKGAMTMEEGKALDAEGAAASADAADPGPAPSAPNDVFGPAPSAPNDIFGPPPGEAPAAPAAPAAQPEAK
jgi:uncharacterized membrane protein